MKVLGSPSLSLAAAAILCFAIISPPQTISDFEALHDGDARTSQVTGLTFTNAQIATKFYSLNELDFPAHSGQNVASDTTGPVTIQFSTPVGSFSGYFTHKTALTIAAFNASGMQIAMISSAKNNNTAVSGDAGSSPNESLSVTYSTGIAKVVVTASPTGSSFTMDDVATTAVSTGGGGGGGGGGGIGGGGGGYTISAMPVSVTLNAAVNDSAPPTQTVLLTAPIQIGYSATASDPWITFTGSSVTGSNLTVGINPTGLSAGVYTGSISITSTLASNSPLTIPVTLNLGPIINSVVSSATFQSGGFAPGSIATVFGLNLTTSTLTAATLPLPTMFGGISATLGGTAVPFYYVSPTQVNLDVPYGLSAGPTQLRFTSRGATVSYPVLIAAASPAIFLVDQYAAAIDSDGTINGARAGFGAVIAGNYVSIYMTGGGSANPDGTLQASTTGTIGGQNSPVLYAGLNQYLIGVDQINLTVPASLASGDYPITIYIGGIKSNSPLLKVIHP